jgi:uncharacterized protein YqeY
MLNIRDEYKRAMLDKSEDRKRVLGNLIAQMKNKEIELRAKNKELTEEDIIGLIQKTIKQNTEANQLFAQGGRNDLIKQNDVEIAILQAFLPKQLSESELDEAIKGIIAITGAQSIKDMGKVIGQMKTKYSGQVDMGVASTKVKALLGG